MSFLIDVQQLKTGLIIFRRADVQHKNWYCRIKVPDDTRYKTISLKTSDVGQAREKAFDHDADIRFRVRHSVPVFDKSFAQVVTEYLEVLKAAADTGEISLARWKVVEAHIRLHLIPYVGSLQIALVGEDKWRTYPQWRKQNGKARDGGFPKDGTVRQEMTTFRAIMSFAAAKGYVRERQVPKGKLPKNRARREAFTPQEYRDLHRYARKWIKEESHILGGWYRSMVYNFMLVMTNTGMRTIEARNLRWCDVDARLDPHGRVFVVINVRGKDKFRELVAAENVASYLERIRAITKASKPEDFVFTNYEGQRSVSLYKSVIQDLFAQSGLLYSSTGGRRSAYSFRHTYATFRLMEGVDVYFLAKQMGTSVKMIEDHYGHITPAKNAGQILQGVPGWDSEARESRPDGLGSSPGRKPKAGPKSN